MDDAFRRAQRAYDAMLPPDYWASEPTQREMDEAELDELRVTLAAQEAHLEATEQDHYYATCDMLEAMDMVRDTRAKIRDLEDDLR